MRAISFVLRRSQNGRKRLTLQGEKARKTETRLTKRVRAYESTYGEVGL